MMKRKRTTVLCLLLILLSGCSDSNAGAKQEEDKAETVQTYDDEVNTEMKLTINETEVPVTWEDNDSLRAIMDMISDQPLSIQMSMYGGFEQVGELGQSIIRDDRQITTSPGDIVLYAGNSIVVFYGSNSWAYTRLGHIDLSEERLKDLLGNGDVAIVLSR
ncbi:MAG: hypothetical protein IIZ80_03575 [Erysipelotrichaceae bacterium]|nr:hypothetical protein [Erysipelotrichaceae bacterium]